MPIAWSESDLAAKGYGPDGRRYPARPYPAGRNGAAMPGADPAESVQRRAPPALLTGRTNAGPDATQPAAGGSPAPHRPTAPPPHRLSTAALRRLTPEQRLQIEVVQLYRPLLRPDARLLGINGELPGGGRMQALRAAVRREMGYVRGMADILACRTGHTLWLEGKVGTDQSDEQSWFAAWAHRIGHGYAVFTGVEDAGVLLRIHGMLA